MDTTRIIDAIEAHQWQVLIALALLALTALAGDVCVRARVRGRALQVVSLVRGYVGGVAGALLVGGAWWHSLIVGLAATGVSAGARDLLVDGVRWVLRRQGVTLGVLLLALSVGAPSCACWQAVQALRSVETEADVWEAMPLVAECAEEAGELLGQCRAGGIDGLLDGEEQQP